MESYSKIGVKDKLVWAHTKTGNFTMKYAPKVASMLYLDSSYSSNTTYYNLCNNGITIFQLILNYFYGKCLIVRYLLVTY